MKKTIALTLMFILTLTLGFQSIAFAQEEFDIPETPLEDVALEEVTATEAAAPTEEPIPVDEPDKPTSGYAS